MIHRHHRVLGNREDNRPINILMVEDSVHQWIHANPKEAMELGWIVSKHQDPADISVCIPDKIIVKAKREKKEATDEAPRKRASIGFRIPKDSQENGAEAFDTLWNQAVELLDSGSEGVTTSGETGKFGVLMAVLYFFVTHYQPE